MNAHYFGPKCSQLTLAAIVSVFIVGCATQPSSKPAMSSQLSDIEGKWSWDQQGPWHGYFVLEKDGDAYTGTLDDTFEGTYGDRIEDVVISDDHIKFTRDGDFGIQYWEGTLKVEDGLLKIIDGRWQKQGGFASGTFLAEKRD
jgi:hypothetical protein